MNHEKVGNEKPVFRSLWWLVNLLLLLAVLFAIWTGGWEYSVRRVLSLLFFFLSCNALMILLILRVLLAFIADHHLGMPRLRLRHSLNRAVAVFSSTPGIK
jgi:hypothetical protein